MVAELDTVTLVLDVSGDEFSFWTSCVVSDDFLTPCQTVSLEAAVDETRYDLLKRLQTGTAYTVMVNGNPQCTGFIDSVDISADSEGTRVSVEAHDVLWRVVAGNVDPRMPTADEMSLEELAQKLFVDQFGLQCTIIESNDKARNAALGKAVTAQPRKTKRKIKDKLKDLRPRDGEGGFGYFTRFAHRNGFHVWASPEGKDIVVSGPAYDQSPSYEFVSRLGKNSGGNNIERARARKSIEGVPSNVWVRGKDSRPGEKSPGIGYYDNFANVGVFIPFYLRDDQSNTKDHCDTVAAYVVGKAMRNFLTYEITVRGLSDPASGRVFNVDTIANVLDERCGVEGPMWVESRTLRKSASGTFTDLKLIPANALILDNLVNETPPPPPPTYPAAKAQAGPPPNNFGAYNGVEFFNWAPGGK